MSHHPELDKKHKPETPSKERRNSREQLDSIPSSHQQLTPEKKKPDSIVHDNLQKTSESVRLRYAQLPLKPVEPKKTKKLNAYTGCNCTKSQCLKMYCVCFAEGKMCDKTCLCDSCKNKTENPERSDAIVEVIEKDPLAFSRKQEKTAIPLVSCNCLKSNCLKKYCDCYTRGKICGKECNCRGCKNNHSSSLESKMHKKVKTQ